MKLLIYGIVQGVGFRPAVYRVARGLGLKGFVRNNGSNVEIVLDKNYKVFLKKIQNELPPLARIDRIEFHADDTSHIGYSDFVILHSAKGKRLAKDSPIPPDTALCPNCIGDIFDPNNRRYLYPFTNCTNCGARYSVILSLPYDRENTSMDRFHMCKVCQKEYISPEDRRFHAQTISCPKDGPKYTLYNKLKKKISTDDPIREFARMIDAGRIGIAKSWGGSHIICNLTQTERLRRWYSRPQKPFAVMVRDIKTARRFVSINEHEEKLLLSPPRPIVFVKKRNNTSLLDAVSPSLDNIGIYLPYSGLHHILFHYMKSDSVISTSANPRGEPMITNNDDSFKLGLDCYLLHNREIINRIDDSVIIPFRDRTFFLRRSRGYVPQAMDINHKKGIVCLGAEENVTSSVSNNGSLYISQYIGDTAHYNVMQFLDDSTKYLIGLIGLKDISAVGIDLHPQYPSRNLGKDWARTHNAKLVEVQHHWAHAASLMLDNNLDSPIIALTLDGTGYGSDGSVWGGEVLHADYKKFNRVGSLEQFPLIGGDAAVRDPRRLVFAIHKMINRNTDYFDRKTSDVLTKLSKSSVKTSSMGRTLDALSCRLGICTNMTYDGEPAMKLERYLDIPKRTGFKKMFTTKVIQTQAGRTVRTMPLFEQLDDLLMNKKSVPETAKKEIAYSFVSEIIKHLVDIAADEAEKHGIKNIGITGGVSYNIPITEMTKRYVSTRGLKLILHNNIPNGDGGISAGQNAIVGNLI